MWWSVRVKTRMSDVVECDVVECESKNQVSDVVECKSKIQHE